MNDVEARVGHEKQSPGLNLPWLPTCGLCGAVYFDRDRHVEWHLSLDGR